MWVTYRCAQGIAVVGVRVCDCSVCLCLPKQRRLVRDIYRPSATALATVGSRPRGRFLGQLYLEEAAGVPVPGLSLMWCLVTCWRFFLRFSSKKKKTPIVPYRRRLPIGNSDPPAFHQKRTPHQHTHTLISLIPPPQIHQHCATYAPLSAHN